MWMNDLRAHTLSLHPRAGRNPAWVSGIRSSSTTISRRDTTAESNFTEIIQQGVMSIAKNQETEKAEHIIAYKSSDEEA